jgi:hypothetical protein
MCSTDNGIVRNVEAGSATREELLTIGNICVGHTVRSMANGSPHIYAKGNQQRYSGHKDKMWEAHFASIG